MKRILLGALLSAIAVFLWGFLFWAGGIAQVAAGQLSPEGEEALRSALVQYVPATGVYTIPDPTNGTFEEFAARHRMGPIAHLYIVRGGAAPMSPIVFILGFIHMFVVAWMLGLGLRAVLPVLPGYGQRIRAVVAVGVIATIWTQFGDAIWFYHPWPAQLMTVSYDLIAFALMGALLARFVRPE